MAAAFEHSYRYPAPSSIAPDGWRLLTSSPGESPRFFSGKLLQPDKTAAMLLALSNVVGTRFYTPPSMVQRLIREADPVVTSSRTMLRFEGFSLCCGVYARVDLDAEVLEPEFHATGTTNVDFNEPMRLALRALKSSDAVELEVGLDAVRLQTASADIVEKKVELPRRWIRGMAEVGSVQSSLEYRFEFSGVELRRFLRALPKAGREAWLVPQGNKLRLSKLPSRDGVRVAGLDRLATLARLIPQAKSMRVWSGDAGAGFVLISGSRRFTLVLSAEPWRGLSGEGQLLIDLSNSPSEHELAALRGSLNWQDFVPADAPHTALSHLAASGLVGFDLVAGSWFHRELPFDRQTVDDLNPRIASAKELITAGNVNSVSESEFRVGGMKGYLVTRDSGYDSGWRCTCPWFGKHQEERGPCKHVLAVGMKRKS